MKIIIIDKIKLLIIIIKKEILLILVLLTWDYFNVK